jgi:hypothetical protein
MGLKEMETQTYTLPQAKLDKMITRALQEPQDKARATLVPLRPRTAVWGGGLAFAASLMLAVLLWPAGSNQNQRTAVAAEGGDPLFDMAMLEILEGV